MDCSTPGFPVLHYLPEFAQTHVHWVGDAIQSSHPLLSPSPPTFNLSQHQGLFQCVGSSHQVAKVYGASVSASVLPINIQDLFPLGLTGLISLQFRGLSGVFSSTTVRRHQFLSAQPFLLSSSHMTRGKSIALTIWIFVGKVMSLLFNTLSRFVIAFLPRVKSLLISWLQSPSTVILEPKKIKCVTVSIVSPSMCCKVMGPDAMIFVFWMLSFKPALLELSSIISSWILAEVMALHVHTTPFLSVHLLMNT